MGQSQTSEGELSVTVRNLGGIDESTVQLRTGVNVLSGRNATNRTSLLRALMGALGSDGVSLKADATDGEVTLETADGSYSRRLERSNGTVSDSGSPYLDDPTLADLFAFLLESNEARQAVSRGDNLRELIMRPVDIAEINAEIEQTLAEKRRLDERIDELSGLEADLPELEAEKTALETEIEELEAEIDTARAEIEELDALDATEAQEAVDTNLEELQSVQSELEETRFQRETERESIETLRAQRAEIEAELDALPETPADDREEIETRLAELRRRRSELDSTTSQLQSVIQFNEEMLEGTSPVIAEALKPEEAEPEAVTDQLVDGSESVVCWTCGTEVETDDIESTVDRLREVRQETLTERRELRGEIESLTDRKHRLEDATETRADLQRRLDRTDDELDSRTERLDALEDDLESLRQQATELENRIEAHEESTSAVLDQHTTINELEFELGQRDRERQQLIDRIETLEAKLEEREQLEDDRAELQDRLTELRTRVDQLESEAVDAFNEHMSAVLDILGYDNLDRIWIERTTETVTEGRQRVEQSVFQLHIVRRSEDGRNYEDTVAHLSESEREVTGLVFALAGYLVHEVHEEVPFMLLDSLEAIDADRIAALVDYVSDYVETVVVALLPEDAQALDDSYHRVTEI